MVKIYRLLPAFGFFLFIQSGVLMAQDTLKNPVEAIRELHQGYLVIRFPAFQNKIETLTSMIAKSEDGPSRKRLESLRNEAIEERDSLREDYVAAFQSQYNFSKVVYFTDTEARDLKTAKYYDLNKSQISYQELHQLPVYYLVFGRSEESKIDALTILDIKMKRIPAPFPNDFSRGGFNFLFITLAENKYAEWRVKKMNKKLHKFWEAVN
jgi:hypothetical protein